MRRRRRGIRKPITKSKEEEMKKKEEIKKQKIAKQHVNNHMPKKN